MSAVCTASITVKKAVAKLETCIRIAGKRIINNSHNQDNDERLTLGTTRSRALNEIVSIHARDIKKAGAYDTF